MSEDIARELAKPLNPAAVRPPPKGKYGEYVDAHHVISEANRIFGWDGWSYDIKALEMCSRVVVEDKGQIRVGYIAQVTVMINGTHRTGAGAGSGISKVENEADAHDSAAKEAETDALKRALRSFGNTFGLALYDKTKADVREPEKTPEEKREAYVERAIAAIKNAPDEAAIGLMVHREHATLLRLQSVAPDSFEKVRAAAAERGITINFDEKEAA